MSELDVPLLLPIGKTEYEPYFKTAAWYNIKRNVVSTERLRTPKRVRNTRGGSFRKTAYIVAAVALLAVAAAVVIRNVATSSGSKNNNTQVEQF